ncbi:MAG: hypothetical protein ABSB96_03985 [Gaiellaceae bacterium]
MKYRRQLSLIGFLFVIALALATLASAANPRKLVLQQADVGTKLQVENPGDVTPAKGACLGGYTAYFHYTNIENLTSSPKGPIWVTSMAEVFKRSRDAHAAEAGASIQGSPTPGFKVKKVSSAHIGDESRLYINQSKTYTWGDNNYSCNRNTYCFSGFVYIWRSGTVLAYLDVDGFTGKITLADARRLAVKQQARIQSAR